ncbi:hypothetical protein CWI37_1171p0020 [Hamiltosporidium tvaerminnensis]|uniref:Uncharacterized protein n=2 Tax=Hamiltosporidium TaxID=1176354 RepID=A0A4Q9LPA4_9MICR|nr:hypothetical protein CWI37_1348p0010 [Hamiltosporidium tvaerminnensis]TBU06750.1 hypothetical protein CWI36_0387p0050 [Hamiltosporidium magnivora]TBT99915.1 hypothetical protein CWI37_1171p0020 [Hamiltosporidium tvaerminnensis]TBU09988.1 hypothetical protein CWI39_0007p0070 [Hamiltosporidium magnivora]TBU10010.1 hypothetical protein CWI39_0003p0050 [Hamiltosporidium magnivora]
MSMIFTTVLIFIAFAFTNALSQSFFIPSQQKDSYPSYHDNPVIVRRFVPHIFITRFNSDVFTDKDNYNFVPHKMTYNFSTDNTPNTDTEHKKQGSTFKSIRKYFKDFMSSITITRVLVILLIAVIAGALGYQLRKGEEHGNYVRLPTST